MPLRCFGRWVFLFEVFEVDAELADVVVLLVGELRAEGCCAVEPAVGFIEDKVIFDEHTGRLLVFQVGDFDVATGGFVGVRGAFDLSACCILG